MHLTWSRLFSGIAGIAAALLLATPGYAAEGEDKAAPEAGDTDEGSLAKSVQNPIADLVSVPFQNNTSYNIGSNERAANTLNIQPVIPLHLSEDVLMVARIIAPIVYQPDLDSTGGGSSGFGDLNPSFFFCPAKATKLMWGVGPVFTLPTATQRNTGSGKWTVGPTAVLVYQPKHWTVGVLANQVWSFAGPDDRASVSLMTVQYFVNYNLPNAWYLTSAPILTFNWKASTDEEWLVPFGGGVGKIFKLGKLPLNGSFQAFYNVRSGDAQTLARWQMRAQIAFLFPTGKHKPEAKPKPEETSSGQAQLLAPPIYFRSSSGS